MVIINPDAFEVKNIQLQALSAKNITAYTTSLTVNVEKKSLNIIDKNVMFDMPAKSVTTIVINL